MMGGFLFYLFYHDVYLFINTYEKCSLCLLERQTLLSIWSPLCIVQEP